MVMSVSNTLFVLHTLVRILLVVLITSYYHYAPPGQYIAPDPGDIRKLRGHRLPVTCVVATPDDKYVYSGAKDCCIIKCKLHHVHTYKWVCDI